MPGWQAWRRPWRTRLPTRTGTLDFHRSPRLKWSIGTGRQHSKGTPGMNHPRHGRVSPEGEAFLQAILWEEGHLVQGPASRTAEEHGLSLLRLLEPANRLSPNLRGEALNRLTEGPCPSVKWPWSHRTAEEVLTLLWERLSQSKWSEEPAAPTLS